MPICELRVYKTLERVIINLTTIPTRIHLLAPTLQSLLDQKAKIEAINLYVPRTYRRAELTPTKVPPLPAGINVVMLDEDLGPATKIVPAIRAYRGQDVKLIFCDDDKIFDPDWAQRLIDTSNLYPDCAVTIESQTIKFIHWMARYRKREFFFMLFHLATLGLWKRRRAGKGKVYADIMEGWGGAMVKPQFFDDAVFDIPDIYWTVDDIWLSGHLEVRGVKIVKAPKGNERWENPVSTPYEPLDALKFYTYKGYNRAAADLACVQYFQREFGIWT